MSQHTLLFVDDEADLLELYRTVFTREGYRVAEAVDAATARQRIAAGDVDLVVLDIRLAEVSGLELLREIKTASPGLPVVISTAFARYQDDFTSWLADAYVVKSSDLGELQQTVARLLGPPTETRTESG